MKCRSRTEYDCFYLSKSNIEEFVEWVKSFNFNIISTDDYDNYLEVIGYTFEFYYNRWYVYKDGQLFDYDPEYFLKHYSLILVD